MQDSPETRKGPWEDQTSDWKTMTLPIWDVNYSDVPITPLRLRIYPSDLGRKMNDNGWDGLVSRSPVFLGLDSETSLQEKANSDAQFMHNKRRLIAFKVSFQWLAVATCAI
jgi:hypothetical protein